MNNENKKLTGYPSIDKPWLKYYSEEAINAKLPECSIYEYLYNNNKEHLNDCALDYYGRKISFSDLFDNIEKTAKAFAAIGVTKGDIITMVTVTIPETIYALYALNRLGAIANFVDPRTSAEGISDYIKEVGSKIIVAISGVYDNIRKAIDDCRIERVIVQSPADSLPAFKKAVYKLTNKEPMVSDSFMYWSDFIKEQATPYFVDYEKNHCCAIVHTGGTTGIPKGVMLSDDNLNSASFQADNSPILVKRGDTFLNIMLPFVAYGLVLGLHTALTCGWKSILIPVFQISEFTSLLIKHRPNAVMGVTSFYENMINDNSLKNVDFSFLKAALVGGDIISIKVENEINEFLKAHNCNIHLSKGYSMTEASATTTISFENANEPGSNGIPLTHTIIGVFSTDTNTALKYGELGEICIQTPTMMIGYYNNSSETDKVIKKHIDGSVWLHTGDIGYINENGMLYIQNRIKRIIIKYDGRKVFPHMIENSVMKCDGVLSCCAVGVPDCSHVQGALPIVYIIAEKSETDYETLKAEITSICAKELTDYAQPVDFRFIDEMPLTPIGKVDYRALEKMAEEKR